jgi:GT2 family glycosyltransferase
MCAHDWIICLDDDEILSPPAAAALRTAAERDEADVVFVPMRHYFFGRYVPGAPTLGRRDAQTATANLAA